eukprot:2842220-Lingulodinium_polyedra.AAC.1
MVGGPDWQGLAASGFGGAVKTASLLPTRALAEDEHDGSFCGARRDDEPSVGCASEGGVKDAGSDFA